MLSGLSSKAFLSDRGQTRIAKDDLSANSTFGSGTVQITDVSTLRHDDGFVFQTALLLKTQCPGFAEVGCSPCGASDQKGRLFPDER